MRMSSLPLLLIASLWGCVRSPSPAPVRVEEDTSIHFPQFFDRAAVEVGAQGAPYELDGVTLRALAIAANDFLPPGNKNRPCEYRQEAQHYRVLRQGDIIFIYILPDYEYCGDPRPLDGGARYAISTDGRILRRLFDGEPEEPLQPIDLDAGGWVPARPGVPSGYDELLKTPPSRPPERRDGGADAPLSLPPPAPAPAPDGGLPGVPTAG
jgi:hypothetical protein